jgi:hypothetical protein
MRTVGKRNKNNKTKHNKTARLNKSFKKANCAPSTDKKDYTCYSEHALTKMKNLWNARHPDHKIEADTPHAIWKQLKVNMSDVCDVESCWLKQNFIANDLDKELASYTFTPKSPKSWTKNLTEWLSSVDIENVMKQYENTYKCFQFIGPAPIDFDTHVMYNKCVWDELCNFDLQRLVKKGKNKIGIIFNTDPHYLNGSHWISLFVNIKKGFIFFFDSNGDPVPNEIDVLCERIIKQAKALNIDMKFSQNAPFEHQFENTECGMYSLYLVTSLIEDKHDYSYFMKHRVPDDSMKQLRLKLFTVGGD